ncbi:hypothetical protein LENED_009388 [Lentinula edodes]|uniref:Uncharacterized protein n=1 Tax=Lentinula edodes TaxID=5353 RepID=A0A1Q3EJQ8_LENED|nr:hypothetical protein LENED_009388 [Lentinula edodes]
MAGLLSSGSEWWIRITNNPVFPIDWIVKSMLFLVYPRNEPVQWWSEHSRNPHSQICKFATFPLDLCRWLANRNTGHPYSTVMPIVEPHRPRSEDVDVARYGQTGLLRMEGPPIFARMFCPQPRTMARRRTHQLQSLYRQRISRPISPSDGPGWIYVYIDNGNEFKIGMTKNFERHVERNLLSTFFWRFSASIGPSFIAIRAVGVAEGSDDLKEENFLFCATIGGPLTLCKPKTQSIIWFYLLSILYNSDYI